MTEQTLSKLKRVWERVDTREWWACWPWIGAKTTAGYGHMMVDAKRRYSHRIVFFLTNGYWPEVVCHRCDVPSCCNPSHLFGGTQRDNMADMIRKRRNSCGERHNAKLTADQVMDIRRRYVAGSIPQHALGREFGVTRRAIGNITEGRTWRHLLPPA